MKRPIESSLRWALIGASLTALLVGCSGVDGEGEAEWSGDVATHEDELWRGKWRRAPHGAGTGAGGAATGTGGSVSAGGRVVDVSGDCEVCARAQACCTSVQAGALCTFSEPTCESLGSVARDAYVNSCRTLIQTVASVRTTLPAACR
jgi:hypothetical protein